MISASVKTRFEETCPGEDPLPVGGSAGRAMDSADTITQVGVLPSSIADTAEIRAGEEPDSAGSRSAGRNRPLIHVGQKIGKYEVRDVLGQGGQARAFRAWDPDLERDVVLKIFHATSAEAVDEVLREGRALAKVRSSFVAQCFGAEHFKGLPYLVLEYVPGRTLVELQAAGELKVRRVLELVAQVSEGLAAVHAGGLLHRDVKPSNILVGDDGLPRLVDFGLAEPVAGERSRSISGTLAYMAPEQARGEVQRIGPASDVFGVGAVLYELLTGQPPFTGETESAVLEQAREGNVLPIDSLRRGLPRRLASLCMRCLAEDPQSRFENAAELRVAIGKCLRATRRGFRGLSFGFRLGKRRFRFQLSTFASMILAAALLGRVVQLSPPADEPSVASRDADTPLRASPAVVNQSTTTVPVREAGLRLSEKSRRLVEALEAGYLESGAFSRVESNGADLDETINMSPIFTSDD